MNPIATASALEIAPILTGVIGGLAIFLFGLEQMTDGLKAVAGGRMKTLLARLTTNRFSAAFTGAFVTAVVQSSSVTTVLVVGFISAGLMSLNQSVAVIMGANVGSTLTAQLIAFKITEYALVMIAVGLAARLVRGNETLTYLGTMLLGLGLIFFGMELMSEAMAPLRTSAVFIDAMQRIQNPLLGIVVAAAFTALVQSSAATTGIVIVLAGQGLVTLEAAIALVFGANIGTCVTALLAAVGKPAPAVQAAVSHVVFNVAGVLLWFGLIDQLALLVRACSPAAPELTGVARLAAETPRQVANAHTIFNIANTLVFLGFTGALARLVEWLLPIREEPPAGAVPRYLDPVYLETPSLALDRMRLELARVGEVVLRMLDGLPRAVLAGGRRELEAIRAMDDEIDALHEAIIRYASRLSQQELTREQLDVMHRLLMEANYIESAGDIIETELVHAGLERLGRGEVVASETATVEPLYLKVRWAVEQTIAAAAQSDRELAAAVVAIKPEIASLAARLQETLAERLGPPAAISSAEFRLLAGLIENLQRIYYFAKRIAKVIHDTDEGGEAVAAARA